LSSQSAGSTRPVDCPTERKYPRVATSEERKLTLKVKVDDDATKPLNRIGGAADDAKDDFDGLNLGLKRLDDKVDETTKTITRLRTEIAKTGDVELIKDITKQEQRLKALAKQRKSLLGDMFQPGDIADAGIGISARLGPIIIKNLPKALTAGGGAGAAIGAPIAIGLAAYLGAGAGAAVIGGAAAGAIAGGVALAARDERVAAAGKELSASIGSQLENAAQPFVPATLKAISIIRTDVHAMDADLQGIFDASAGYVEPLTRSMGRMVKNVLPGLRKGVESAGPVMRELGGAGERIGQAIGDTFEDISRKSPEAAGFVRELGINAADTVSAIGDVVVAFADLYGGIIRAEKGIVDFQVSMSGWVPWVGGQLKDRQADLNGIVDAMDKAGKEGKEAGDKAGPGIKNIGDAAHDAAPKVETLADALKRVTDQNFTSEEAAEAFEEAIDHAAEVAKEGAKGINIHTAAGRDNRKALRDVAEAARAVAADVLKVTGNNELAAEATERGRRKFLELADSMGVSSTEAVALANKLFGIPSPKPKVDLDSRKADAALKALKAKIAQIDKPVHIKATFDLIENKDVAMALRLGRLSTGGPVKGSGPKGVDSQPYLLAPGEYVLSSQDVDRLGGTDAIDAMRRDLAGAGRGRTATSVEAKRRELTGPTLPAVTSGTVRHEITIRWPDGSVAGRIVADGFASASDAVGGLREAIRRGGNGNVQAYLGQNR